MRSLFFLLALFGCSKADSGAKTGDEATNQAPIADAGPDLTQTADSAVNLSGQGSRDPEGDPLTFKWTFTHVPEGSTITDKEAPFSRNYTADASTTSFQPDKVGTYIVQLIVNDGTQDSPPDTAFVTINEPENLPVANAGVDVVGAAGATVSLDGSKSYDPQGRSLTYAWTLVDKPSASALTGLTASDTVAPSFVPDSRGVYVVNLVVDNGLAKSTADSVAVTVTGDDNAPVAYAGEDQNSAEDCTTIQLDCSSSVDPDGDKLTYSWLLQDKPKTPVESKITTNSLSDKTSARPTFFPDQAGTYVWSCAVFDGKTWSTPDTVNVVTTDRKTNTKPVAEAGDNEAVDGGSAECTESGYTYNCDECANATVTLGGSARASDPDSDPYTVLWTVMEGEATIASSGQLVTTATLSGAEPEEPGECVDVEYRFMLTVTDCTGESTTDEVIYTLSCCGSSDT